MFPRSTILLFACLIGVISANTLYRPDMSSSITTYEGDPDYPSISIECRRPSQGWGDARYIQIYRYEISLHRIGEDEDHTYPGIGRTYHRIRYMSAVIAIPTKEIVYKIPRSKYSVQVTDAKVALIIDVPAHYDSGLYECRTTMVNSDDYTSEGAVSTSRADIRIIEPSSIRIVTADVSGLNWYHDLDVTNEDEITFATEVPKHFGCEVRYSFGVPDVRAYWEKDSWQTPVNSNIWNTKWISSSIQHNRHDFDVISDIYIVSIFYTTVGDSDTNYFDINTRNGSRFVCRANYPQVPEVAAVDASVLVKTISWANTRPNISGDILTYEGNPNHPSIDIECGSPNGGWGDTQFIQIYKDEIIFLTSGGTVKYNGTSNGQLSFIIATNEILNAFVPSDRYSLTRTTDKLTLTIQNPMAEDSGVYMCRMTAENSTSATIEAQTSWNKAEIIIIQPLSEVRFFMANKSDNWLQNPFQFIDANEVTFIIEEPMIIGCSVHYNTGNPYSRFQWIKNDDVTRIDQHIWNKDEFDSNIAVSSWGASRTAYRMVWTDTTSLQIGSWNGSTLQCLWQMPGLGIQQANISVNTFSLAHFRPNISGDILTYEGDPNYPSIVIECRSPLLGWDAQFIQIYKDEINFPVAMNFSGTVDDTLRYIVASNNVVLEAFPSDTYSASLANGILTLTINYPMAEDSGVYMCRGTVEDSNTTSVEVSTSYSKANITIIQPVTINFFMVPVQDNWPVEPNSSFIVNEVILNDTETHMKWHFGCSARYNTGYPHIIMVDPMDNWRRMLRSREYFHKISEAGGLITNDATVMIWETIGNAPGEIENILLGRERETFTCRVTFDGVTGLYPADESILVKSVTQGAASALTSLPVVIGTSLLTLLVFAMAN